MGLVPLGSPREPWGFHQETGQGQPWAQLAFCEGSSSHHSAFTEHLLFAGCRAPSSTRFRSVNLSSPPGSGKVGAPLQPRQGRLRDS